MRTDPFAKLRYTTGRYKGAADGMKVALVCLQEKLQQTEAKLVAMIHDEVIVECPVAESETVKKLVEQAMVEGMKTFLTEVPVTAEAGVGKTWADK